MSEMVTRSRQKVAQFKDLIDEDFYAQLGRANGGSGCTVGV